MRPIKFRVWHKGDRRFWKQADLDEINLVGGLVDLSASFANQCGQVNQLELQQFTGLKDKNGKEIYEGDIVRVPFFDKAMNVFEVVYRAEYAMFSLLRGGDFYQDRLGESGIEVIGNIFENPELLKA